MWGQAQRPVPRLSLRTVVVVVVIGLNVSSCRDLIESDEPEASGGYSLVRYGDEPLPAHYATAPPREPPGESCELRVTGGALTLSAGAKSAAGGHFMYSYEVKSDCSGKAVSAPHAGGRFWQNGSRLSFEISGVNNFTATFEV
jgi:hypothetical protein